MRHTHPHVSPVPHSFVRACGAPRRRGRTGGNVARPGAGLGGVTGSTRVPASLCRHQSSTQPKRRAEGSSAGLLLRAKSGRGLVGSPEVPLYRERSQEMLRPQSLPPVPEETARVARAALSPTHRYGWPLGKAACAIRAVSGGMGGSGGEHSITILLAVWQQGRQSQPAGVCRPPSTDLYHTIRQQSGKRSNFIRKQARRWSRSTLAAA